MTSTTNQTMVMRAESYNTSPRIKYVIDHQKIIIISLEYHPSLRHNIHTHFQDRIQTIYQPGIPGTDEDGIFGFLLEKMAKWQTGINFILTKSK